MDLAGRPGLYNAAAVRKELAAEVPYFAKLARELVSWGQAGRLAARGYAGTAPR